MSNDISKIDKNFVVDTELNAPDIVFYDVKENPFCLYGVFYDDGCYRRIPEKIAEATNPGVHRLHKNTSGGRLRFMTDSPYVAISVKMASSGLSRPSLRNAAQKLSKSIVSSEPKPPIAAAALAENRPSFAAAL